MNLIDEYIFERTCAYKGETYKVRDNGAVCRQTGGVDIDFSQLATRTKGTFADAGHAGRDADRFQSLCR